MNTDKENEKKESEKETTPLVFPVYPEQELTGKALEAAFTIHNALGAGYVEKVYENSLILELNSRGIRCEQQKLLQVRYRERVVGDFAADIVVEGRVLLELKACSAFDSTHEAQIMNYLRASGLKVGLLLNFGRPKLQYRRFVA